MLKSIAGYDAADPTTANVPIDDYTRGAAGSDRAPAGRAAGAGLLRQPRRRGRRRGAPGYRRDRTAGRGHDGYRPATDRAAQSHVGPRGAGDHAKWLAESPDKTSRARGRRCSTPRRPMRRGTLLAVREVEQARRDIVKAFSTVDLLITPTMKTPAPCSKADRLAAAATTTPCSTSSGSRRSPCPAASRGWDCRLGSRSAARRGPRARCWRSPRRTNARRTGTSGGRHLDKGRRPREALAFGLVKNALATGVLARPRAQGLEPRAFFLVPRDQPRAALKRHVGHRPLDQHDHALRKPISLAMCRNSHASQPIRPESWIQPRSQSPTPADDGHVAEVAIGERRGRLAPLAAQDRARGMGRALSRGLHHARQRDAIAVWTNDAASPTTNTSGCPAIERSGSTSARPARSSGTPSVLMSGDAATPAAQSTVAA